MTPLASELAWNEARRLLGMCGDVWPEALDALDIAGLSEYSEPKARGLVDSLSKWSASGGWCVRESNSAFRYCADTRADGPACFPVWSVGNDVHFLEVRPQGKVANRQLIARRCHTAGETRDFFAALGNEPPRLLAAWIAASVPSSAPPAAEPEVTALSYTPRATPTPKTGKPPAKKSARNALDHAMRAGIIAYRIRHGIEPTARALFDWLGEYDQTGIIAELDRTADKLTWNRADGGLSDTTFKAFQNRLTGIRRE